LELFSWTETQRKKD